MPTGLPYQAILDFLDFAVIDREREAWGISQYALCQRAGIHPTSYLRLKVKKKGGRLETHKVLRQALEDLKSQRRAEIEANGREPERVPA